MILGVDAGAVFFHELAPNKKVMANNKTMLSLIW